MHVQKETALALAKASKKNNQSKENTEQLPWVGSYFDIPEPLENPNPHEPAIKHITEYEMHVLHKDLSTKEFKLQHKSVEYGTPLDEMLMMFRNMAFLDSYAIAFVVYKSSIDAITGEQTKKEAQYPAYFKTKWNKWKSIHLFDQKFNEEFSKEAYSPAIYSLFPSFNGQYGVLLAAKQS